MREEEEKWNIVLKIGTAGPEMIAGLLKSSQKKLPEVIKIPHQRSLCHYLKPH